MVGAGDLQRDSAFDTGFLGGGLGGLKFFGGAGENDLAAPVEVGDFPAGGRGDLGGKSLVRTEQGEHRAFALGAGLVHEDATAGDETETVLDREGSAGGVGGKFAEGETGSSGKGEVRFLFLEDGEEGEAVKDQGRLAVGGAGQGFFRTDLKNSGEVGRQDAGAEFQDFAGGGGGFLEVRPHADPLGPLTGEEESYAWHKWLL